MLAETLQKIIDDELTTVQEIGTVTGTAPSTVYRWLKGQSDPSFSSIRMLIRHLKDSKAQGMLLASLTAATSWRFFNLELDLDINHDGVIDAADAMDASIEAVRAAGRSLSEVRDAIKAGHIENATALNLIQTLHNVIRQATTTQQVLLRLSKQTDKRKIK